MNKFSIITFLIFAFTFASLSVSGQYFSMREERLKVDKTNKNLFQVSVKQEVNSSLNFKILINNPSQELLNVSLKDQGGKLFQDDILFRRPNYSLNLDLARLEDGIYTMSIMANYESDHKIFTITTEELGTRNGQMYLDRKVEVSQENKAK